MSPPPPSLPSRRVLVDTSAFYALTDLRDTNHDTAIAIRSRLIAEQWRLFTTNVILIETHALILSRLGRGVALKILQEIDHSTTTGIRVSTTDERRARNILTQYEDRDFTLADASSFAVMERLNIRFAFTFDRHFAQYGFTVLIPSQP